MHVERLVVEDFRNYAGAQARFAPGVNLLIGRNAQGKTNLLEAVHCLTGLGSPRGPEAALVRMGAERAFLHADVVRGRRRLQLDLEVGVGRSRALVNRTPVGSTRALADALVAVFFGPDELALIKGSPVGRRRFIDDLIVKMRPTRSGLRRDWERALKQRNALLKTWPRSAPESARSTLEVWDDAMARAGAAVAAARLAALGALAPYATKRYGAIAGRGRLELRYVSGWLDAERCDEALTAPDEIDESALEGALRARIQEVREREIERGVSLVGPQRDDLSVVIGEGDGAMQDARVYASQGDQRTSALALKLGEYDLLTATLDETPVLLLDDVFSELDPERRGWLADAVRDLGQTIITSAEPDSVESARAERVIHIVDGRLDDDG